MSGAHVSSVRPLSPAAQAGLEVGDEILLINGVAPTDVIEYQRLSDGAELEILYRRGDEGPGVPLRITKNEGEPLGLTVESAVFDRVRTCDNHCSFCFIYQLPKGLRKSLYVKDDDYRLSFLYGNYTTLTRFTEFDLERTISEGLSPLYVSIHTTNPSLRADMLRNPRGATSLRWLRVLLEQGIEVHGQVVLCPGVNDEAELERTIADVVSEYSDLATLSIVPVGVSDFSTEQDMRPLSADEAKRTLDIVARWQEVACGSLGRTLIHASDEIYLIAGLTPPEANDPFLGDLIENGVGLTAAFRESFSGRSEMNSLGTGFFQSVDGAPAEGYRAERGGSWSADMTRVERMVVLTGVYGSQTLRPLLDQWGYDSVEVEAIRNDFFGSNIQVAGLLTWPDIERHIDEPHSDEVRYVLPDVCINEGRFLDGAVLDVLPSNVDVIPTSGHELREYLDGWLAARST